MAGEPPPRQLAFPLEAVTIHLNGKKITMDSGKLVRYEVHKRLAEAYFLEQKVLSPIQFVEVDWPSVNGALHSVPRMFQIFAAKQVMNVAGTNTNINAYDRDHNPYCPSCDTELETCAHVLRCEEEGRVDVLHKSITLLGKWLRSVHTDPKLRWCLVQYARGRGHVTMQLLTQRCGIKYHAFG